MNRLARPVYSRDWACPCPGLMSLSTFILISIWGIPMPKEPCCPLGGCSLCRLFILFSTCQCCLSSSQSRDRYPERRTTHIIQPHLVAERDTVRIATMLTTDTHFQE